MALGVRAPAELQASQGSDWAPVRKRFCFLFEGSRETQGATLAEGAGWGGVERAMSRHTGLEPSPAQRREGGEDAHSIRPLRRSECHRAGCATCPLCCWATGSPGQRRGWEQGTLRVGTGQLTADYFGPSIPGYPGCVTPRCVIRLRGSCWDILKAKAKTETELSLGWHWGGGPSPIQGDEGRYVTFHYLHDPNMLGEGAGTEAGLDGALSLHGRLQMSLSLCPTTG